MLGVYLENSNKEYWWIGAGDHERDYSQVFLDFGIILVGPDYGNYYTNKKAYQSEPCVRTFVEDVKPGDIVILKRGVTSIVAVGVVEKAQGIEVVNEHEDGYFYSKEIFGNVQGFETAHGRYVTWYKPENEEKIEGISRGTLKRCHNYNIQQISKKIIKNNEPLKKDPIPSPANQVNDEELIMHLIENGLGTGQAEEVVQAFGRIRRLGRWYEDHWKERDKANEEISEHETRTFLIVPLLLALGWSEQRLKIEWNHMDIAFFKVNYKPYNQPIKILESKRLYYPLLHAKEQVTRYTEKYPSCKKVVVSNGIRYLSYEKIGKEWKPKAYLNLFNLQDRHPYDVHIAGAKELFVELLP